MKAQELKADYANKLLSSHTYLYYLIRALRKDGWKLHIPNIKDFCQEWELSERNFYRAKSKLIALDLLNEKIHGAIDLWIDPGDNSVSGSDDWVSTGDDNSVSDSDTYVLAADNCVNETDNSVSDPANCVIKTPLKSLPENGSSDSTPLYTSSTPLSTPLSQDEERELNKSPGDPEIAKEGFSREPQPNGSTFTPLATLLPKAEFIQEKTKDSSDQSSAPEKSDLKSEKVEPEFLAWVIDKVKQFPNPPQFPRKAAIALINRNREDIEAEYREYQALEKHKKGRAAVSWEIYKAPEEPASLSQLEDEEERRAYKLNALKGMWNIESLRPRVIQQSKEWEFVIGPEGPRELEF